MKLIRLGALAPLVLVLAGCAHRLPQFPPPLTSCSDANTGSSAISDVIVDKSSSPNNLNLKLDAGAATGICVEGGTGNIHTFHARTTAGVLYVQIDPHLSSRAKWPSDVGTAVQVWYPGGTWQPWPNATFFPGGLVGFTVPAPESSGPEPTVYRYRFQYVDPHDPSHTPQVVEPMVVNHNQ